jgi:hypothetical protein
MTEREGRGVRVRPERGKDRVDVRWGIGRVPGLRNKGQVEPLS